MSDKIDEQVEIVNYDSQAQDGEKKKISQRWRTLKKTFVLHWTSNDFGRGFYRST